MGLDKANVKVIVDEKGEKVLEVPLADGGTASVAAKDIEEAYQALHAVIDFPPHGTKLVLKDGTTTGVVLIGDVQRVYAKAISRADCPVTVVDENGYGASYETAERLFDYWDLPK